MNANIQDTSALLALGAGEFSAYLRSAGWQEAERIGDRAALWEKRAEKEEFEVLVPQKPSLGDYALRMAQALQALSVVESRSELEIYADIKNTQTDTLRFRFLSSVYENGTVPLSDAARMIVGTRELALAAACATVAPRAVYASRKPQEAIDFLNKARMGQTERGSFVLSLHAPVPPRLRGSGREQPTLALEVEQTIADAEREEPFERRVTLTLARSLNAAAAAALSAQAKGDLAPFEAAVAQGVNANLCDALADLGLETSTQSLVIGFHWSPTRALLGPAPQSVELRSDQFAALREAARRFRESAPIEDYEVYGYVVRLSRNVGDPTGQITVDGYVEDRPRRIKITLGDAEYRLAEKAHSQEDVIRCAGELVREGRSYTLRNPHSIVIVE